MNGFIVALPKSSSCGLAQKYRKTLQQSQIWLKLSQLLNLESINDYKFFASVWDHVYGPEKDLSEYFVQQRRLPRYMQL